MCVYCSGLAPTLMGVSHVMIQLPLYEAGKQYCIDRRKSEGVSEVGPVGFMPVTSRVQY